MLIHNKIAIPDNLLSLGRERIHSHYTYSGSIERDKDGRVEYNNI